MPTKRPPPPKKKGSPCPRHDSVEGNSLLTLALYGDEWSTARPGCFVCRKGPRYTMHRKGRGGAGPVWTALIPFLFRDSNFEQYSP